jgi:hypothetical protein
MKCIVKLLLFIVIELFVQLVYAEGGSCPDGYYPIGGQGTMGCAPLPDNYYGNNSNNYASPVKWVDRWGSIVIGWDANNNGIFGKSVNMPNKADAEATAMKDCKLQRGGTTCYVAITYEDQCAALAVGTGHGGGTSGGQNPEEAKQGAIKACTRGGGKDCYVLYSACSMAVRVQ